MGVVACVEIAKGTGVSGKFGESFTFTRKWIVRVDNPRTSRVEIAQAADVQYGDPHPDAAAHVAMEFDCTEESGDGMIWGITVRYYVPPAAATPDPENPGVPVSTWAASNSTSSVPAYQDKDGEMIVNSAGDPLEGIERDDDNFSLTLTKYYDGATNLAWSALAETHSNTVNADAWNGSPARTWKVEFKSASKKPSTTNGGSETTFYWETTWEFRYKADTWDLKPWDIGFNQLVDSTGAPLQGGTLRAAILGADKKPVRQPVALSYGVAKTAGQYPDELEFRVYRETDFSAFGTPS